MGPLGCGGLTMEKPKFFFYQFPTGGPKFTLWPISDGSYRLEVDGNALGVFADVERAIIAASVRFTEMHYEPDLADTAEKMLDIDWWERSPTSQPEGVKL